MLKSQPKIKLQQYTDYSEDDTTHQPEVAFTFNKYGIYT